MLPPCQCPPIRCCQKLRQFLSTIPDGYVSWLDDTNMVKIYFNSGFDTLEAMRCNGKDGWAFHDLEIA